MKTLLILVDGMRPDALTSIPAAQKIIKNSLSTMTAKTVMPSVTLPCHVSLFHSVDPERHGTTTNVYAPQVRPVTGLCELLKKNKKTSAFFYSWEELRDVSRPASLIYSCFHKGDYRGYAVSNDYLTDEAIKFISENDVEFTFLYLGSPDEAGHKYGWMGEEYMASVAHSFDCIERIINSLSDDYAVIITADHGGHDRSHGKDIPEDMLIPLILLGNGIDTDADIEGATILDIAPTFTKLLGIEPDDEWEGRSLI